MSHGTVSLRYFNFNLIPVIVAESEAVIMSSRIPPRLRDLLAFFHSVHRCYPIESEKPVPLVPTFKPKLDTIKPSKNQHGHYLDSFRLRVTGIYWLAFY